jgi:hypothetical protein
MLRPGFLPFTAMFNGVCVSLHLTDSYHFRLIIDTQENLVCHSKERNEIEGVREQRVANQTRVKTFGRLTC